MGNHRGSSPEVFAVCLSVCREKGEPDWPGRSCAGAGENGLWAHIWVRRKCSALSLDTEGKAWTGEAGNLVQV